ncbi:hypothetical protein Golob_020143 [Gossypium lobatum]|uniref:Uncharacterized protein n=1 Tax=Gossypium lobatum TaxID=34289 RepID=A0A7J8L9F2_9ROSI|nr:hypothetical protein [Gossypium lobatum]
MIIGPSNVDYGPTVSNRSHGSLIANTAASNSNSSLPKSTDFLDLPVSPTKNLPSRINVISKQGKSNVVFEKIDVTTLNSDCHSVIKFVEIRNPNNSKGNQPINISSRTQDERNIGSDALKMGDTKRPRKDSHILRGKGSKFKVRANSCESVVEAMSKVVEKIRSNSLIMDSSYGKGALTNLRCASPKFACIVREYFVNFEIDVATFLKTKVSGPKANEIISKIGLDCSHRIEARVSPGICGFVGRRVSISK